MSTLSQNTVRRLVMVKRMFLHASRYAAEPGELAAVIAVHAVDHAIEMLLKLVTSHFGSATVYNPPQNGYYNTISSLQNQKYNARMDFYRLWDEVQGIFRDPSKGVNLQLLPLRREIELLHNMRNDVQHNGITPNTGEVRKYMAYAESFLRDVTISAFQTDVTQITLSSLIRDDEIRILVTDAENAFGSGDYTNCVISATKAFELTSNRDKNPKLTRRGLPRYLRTEFKRSYSKYAPQKAFEDLARSISRDRTFTRSAQQAADYTSLEKALDKLGDLLEAFQREIIFMNESMEVIALGADLRQYRRFREISPRIVTISDGKMIAKHPEDWQPSKSEAAEVMSFVFDTVINWQDNPISNPQ